MGEQLFQLLWIKTWPKTLPEWFLCVFLSFFGVCCYCTALPKNNLLISWENYVEYRIKLYFFSALYYSIFEHSVLSTEQVKVNL